LGKRKHPEPAEEQNVAENGENGKIEEAE